MIPNELSYTYLYHCQYYIELYFKVVSDFNHPLAFTHQKELILDEEFNQDLHYPVFDSRLFQLL